MYEVKKNIRLTLIYSLLVILLHFGVEFCGILVICQVDFLYCPIFVGFSFQIQFYHYSIICTYDIGECPPSICHTHSFIKTSKNSYIRGRLILSEASEASVAMFSTGQCHILELLLKLPDQLTNKNAQSKN